LPPFPPLRLRAGSKLDSECDSRTEEMQTNKILNWPAVVIHKSKRITKKVEHRWCKILSHQHVACDFVLENKEPQQKPKFMFSW